MSDTERKGSVWPWIVIPLSSFVLFFALRECQQRLPPSQRAPEITVPGPVDAPSPATPAAPPANSDTVPAPAPQ